MAIIDISSLSNKLFVDNECEVSLKEFALISNHDQFMFYGDLLSKLLIELIHIHKLDVMHMNIHIDNIKLKLDDDGNLSKVSFINFGNAQFGSQSLRKIVDRSSQLFNLPNKYASGTIYNSNSYVQDIANISYEYDVYAVACTICEFIKVKLNMNDCEFSQVYSHSELKICMFRWLIKNKFTVINECGKMIYCILINMLQCEGKRQYIDSIFYDIGWFDSQANPDVIDYNALPLRTNMTNHNFNYYVRNLRIKPTISIGSSNYTFSVEQLMKMYDCSYVELVNLGFA